MLKRLSPREAAELVQQGWTYLDVRSSAEFEAGHPAGAVHLPLMERGPAGMVPNPSFLDEVKARFPLDARIVVGCESGGRSQRAAALLAQAGYTQVVEQRCGFGGARGPTGEVVEKGWRDEGLPVGAGKA